MILIDERPISFPMDPGLSEVEGGLEERKEDPRKGGPERRPKTHSCHVSLSVLLSVNLRLPEF